MNTTLGRFKLLRKPGEGAQATVGLAHDPRLQREVVLMQRLPMPANNQLLAFGRADLGQESNGG